jgi:hypothetical protein
MTSEKVLVVFILAILSLVKAGYLVNPVVIEFLYYACMSDFAFIDGNKTRLIVGVDGERLKGFAEGDCSQ